MIEPERKSITIPRVVKPKRKWIYGYIYITTNLINNKKYIGQHSCKANDKNYLVLRK